MSVWRYTAVDLRGSGARRTRGEAAGATAAEVRASLRRIGLQVIDLHEARPRKVNEAGPSPAWIALGRLAVRHLRQRRGAQRAELYDGLATMLASGLPLLEAVDTLVSSAARRRSPRRSMLLQLRESLRGGSSLAQAMADHPGWFEPSEVAMVRAAQVGGTLPDVLRTLSDRQERSGELTGRLIGALTYPTVVTIVGLGVVIFLSVRTLPSLAQILTDAGVEVPALTRRVMAFGQWLAGSWAWLVLGLAAVAVLGLAVAGVAEQVGWRAPAVLRRLLPPPPRLLRRMAVARVTLLLAELLRTGVPLVDALRVIAPTAGSGALRRRLAEAADRIERGDGPSAALDDELWFDAEMRRLIEIGQASGEIERVLERLGHRYARQARRLIDRLTSVLEPAVILALATLVGIVVMSAVLPLLRLQQVL